MPVTISQFIGLREGFCGVCIEKWARFLWAKTERNKEVIADGK